MKVKAIRKLLLIIGVLLVIIYFVVMSYEISNFSPYNTRMPFFLDRVLEFLLPAVVCFLIRNKLKQNE